MKKLFLIPFLALSFASITACDTTPSITVGATPSPHAEILNSDAVQNYVKNKGYNLKVKVYQDYVTPNKALNDGGIDANYFQHIPYLNKEVEEKGYDLKAACQVHNEPLNLYGKEAVSDWSNKKISIVNDASNVQRAFDLLLANNIISSYSVESFDAQNPVYTSDIGVTIECIDPGLLHNKVDEGGYAVIPGNYALTAWSTELATSYRLISESTEVAYPNIIAVRTSDLKSEKTNILVEALASSEVKSFIEATYGPTVAYAYKDLR